MTKEQIQKYNYCSEYIKSLKDCKEKLPFSRQKYGCGTGSPDIEYKLQKIHQDMYFSIIKLIEGAETKVQDIIDKA